MSRHLITTEVFDSLYSFGQYCKNTPRAEGAYDSSGGEATEWTAHVDLAGGIAITEDGGYWEEGAAMMRNAMDITTELAALQPLPVRERAVSGHLPCVAAYVTGHPLNMYRTGTELSSGKPVISIGISMVASASVEASYMMNRGAAVLTMIDELESRGYRCELVSVYRTGPNNTKPFKQWANVEVLLKQASEQYNPVAVAFALAHPAWLRRIGFKAMETKPEWVGITKAGYGDGGNNDKWLNSMAGDFDIVMPNISSWGGGYSTPELAFETVQELINTAIAKLEEGAQ